MKILITGKNGYIGKSIHSYLHAKYDITTVGRQDFDLTDPFETIKFFSDKTFDVVIHTAVVGGSRLKSEESSIIDQNLKMYYNLLDQQNRYTKFISFGSGAEGHLNTPYGLSKFIINQSTKDKPNFYNLRIFGVFDENEWETRFIKTSIRNHIADKPIIINQDRFYDFFYMEDLVKLVDYYITTDDVLLPKEYNCSYPLNFTLSEIAKLINNLEDHEVPVIVDEKEWGENYSGFNGENDLTYSLDMWGLSRGLRIVYNKLKEERYKEMDSIMKQANNSLVYPNENTVSSTIESMTFMYLNTKN